MGGKSGPQATTENNRKETYDWSTETLKNKKQLSKNISEFFHPNIILNNGGNYTVHTSQKMLKEAEREQEKKMHKRTLCPASGLDRESQCKSIKEYAHGIP